MRDTDQPPIAGAADPERGARIDAERVTLEIRRGAKRPVDRGKESIEDSPLFGGPRQGELFS